MSAAGRTAFPVNWPARLGFVAVAAYVIYAAQILEITWARFLIGLDQGGRFLPQGDRRQRAEADPLPDSHPHEVAVALDRDRGTRRHGAAADGLRLTAGRRPCRQTRRVGEAHLGR